MTISIRIGAIYDIETYDGLLEFLTQELELDDNTISQLPTLIRLAEYRLNRLVIAPEREVRTALTTVADQAFVDLPTGFRQARIVKADGETIDFINPDGLDTGAGCKQVYTIQNRQMWLSPTPTSAYEIDLLYLEKLPGLSTTNQTNWLLQGNADAYVYSAIFQICGYLEDLDGAGRAEEELFRIIEEVNTQARRYRNAGPLQMRARVVV